MISLIQYSLFFLFIIIIIIIMGRRNKLSTFEGKKRPAESKIITGHVGVYI